MSSVLGLVDVVSVDSGKVTRDIGDEHPRPSRLHWRRWGHQVTTAVLAVILVIVLTIFRKPVGELRLDPWVAAVFLAMVFHQPIVNRIKNMKSFNTPAGSMQFEAELREVAQDAAEEQQSSSQGRQRAGTGSTRSGTRTVGDEGEGPAHDEPAPGTVDAARLAAALQSAQREIRLRDKFSFYYRFATDHPDAAMVQVREHLDRLAVWAFDETDLEIDFPPLKVLTHLDRLIPFGLPSNIVGTAREVRMLGNRAMHDQIKLTPVAIVNYVNASEQVAIALMRFVAARQAG